MREVFLIFVSYLLVYNCFHCVLCSLVYFLAQLLIVS
uniref:Uncharacterized protein n=1 Tax=Myoviridae sp. ctOoC8 TaxID=2823542 RepID=A0A8S5L6F0_9CAUD|nr:MAG TPA: hypothetical protein [Myoviridae sp. ctOoC8]